MGLSFVKFGGSVLTIDGQESTVDEENVRRLAREFRGAQLAEPDEQWVVALGTGTFGHPQYVRLLPELESDDPSRIFIAVDEIRSSVLELHRRVVLELKSAGVKVVGISPLTFLRSVGDEFSVQTQVIQQALANGLVPVLHGDMVLSDSRLFRVCSSERVLLELVWDCIKHGRRDLSKVVIANATDGLRIHADDEKSDIFEIVTKENEDLARASCKRHPGIDATGGMAQKIGTSIKIAKMGIDVVLVNGGVAGRVKAALKGESVRGTMVKWM